MKSSSSVRRMFHCSVHLTQNLLEKKGTERNREAEAPKTTEKAFLGASLQRQDDFDFEMFSKKGRKEEGGCCCETQSNFGSYGRVSLVLVLA